MSLFTMREVTTAIAVGIVVVGVMAGAAAILVKQVSDKQAMKLQEKIAVMGAAERTAMWQFCEAYFRWSKLAHGERVPRLERHCAYRWEAPK